MYRHLLVPLDDSPLAVETVQSGRHARQDARRESDVLPRAGGLRRVEHRRARARDVARGVQRARGGRGAGDPRQGRSGRAGGRRAARLRDHDERPAARGHSARRRGARLRPDLHRLARPPRHQGADARLADAEGPPADDDSGAGVGGRKQSAGRGDACAAHDDPRRASLACRGHPRARIRRPRRRAIRERRRRFRCCARCCITSRRFRRSCIIRRKTRICSASCARGRSEFDATLDELERQHVEGHRLVDGTGAKHRRLRGGSAGRPARDSRRQSSGFRRRRCSTWRSKPRSSSRPRART